MTSVRTSTPSWSPPPSAAPGPKNTTGDTIRKPLGEPIRSRASIMKNNVSSGNVKGARPKPSVRSLVCRSPPQLLSLRHVQAASKIRTGNRARALSERTTTRLFPNLFKGVQLVLNILVLLGDAELFKQVVFQHRADLFDRSVQQLRLFRLKN